MASPRHMSLLSAGVGTRCIAHSGYFALSVAETGAYAARVRRVRVLVSGSVQGVFFRQGTRRLARSEGCSGWIRNRPDGLVEAVFEGPPESVERLIAWCHDGPEAADVETVEVTEEDPEGLDGFEVRS